MHRKSHNHIAPGIGLNRKIIKKDEKIIIFSNYNVGINNI